MESVVIQPIENAVGKLPMGIYPAGRFVYGAALGSAIVFGLRPKIMWTKSGKDTYLARPWIVTSPDAADATMFPWGAGVLLPALVMSFLL